MNPNIIYIIDDVLETQPEPEKLEKENNMYVIVGMIGDQIKIERL